MTSFDQLEYLNAHMNAADILDALRARLNDFHQPENATYPELGDLKRMEQQLFEILQWASPERCGC